MAAHTHIIGAGLAGLSCAVSLTERGAPLTLYEAAGHAGGRCRSYDDAALGRRIDNGNHLLLSGNVSAMAYLKTIGASDSLTGPDNATFPFFDIKSKESWTVCLNKGVIPWWIFSEAQRVPGTTAWDYLKALSLAWAGPNTTLSQSLGNSGLLFERFWEPLGVAILNASTDEAAASLLSTVIKESFGKGEAFCRPRIAREGLSESFIDPAIAYLTKNGANLNLNTRVRKIILEGGLAASFDLGEQEILLNKGDRLLLAVPPAVASSLLPDLTVPIETRAIVNGHFILDTPHNATDEDLSFIGLVGSVSQWLFVRGDIASVTVSAADKLAEQPAKKIAEILWKEVSTVLKLGDKPLPAHRIVKEKRATFAQTPKNVARRPSPVTAWSNLFLAGDWTNTGLPATIEGAIRSGQIAANRMGP